MQSNQRIVPELPPVGQRLHLVIDTDAANEIDDLYAIALALRSPDRFAVEGFVATHFAQTGGRDSTEASYRVLGELLDAAGMTHRPPILRGGDPMPYREPSKGFFDLGDIGWMIQPDLCTEEVVAVPRMDWMGRFVHEGCWGNMRRVSGIRAEPTWELFFARMK